MAIETSNDPRGFADFEQQGWEEVSHDYAHWFVPLTRQSVEPLLDAAGVEASSRVLDVATGPGVVAAGAVTRNADVTGLDFAAEAIEIARRNVPSASFQVGDAQAMPFADQTFDAVICAYGIMHMPNPDLALAEMRRVLKPDGQLALAVWEAPAETNGFGLLFQAIKSHGSVDVDLPHGPDFFQFGSVEKLIDAMTTRGFAKARAETLPQNWSFANSDGYIASIVDGTVRSRGLLNAQTRADREAIEAALRKGLQKFQQDAGDYRIPMPALIGSAIRE